MIEIVTPDQWDTYQEQLDEFFRLRHQVYVQHRGWKALKRPNGRELDQFDTTDAVYLLWLDSHRSVRGGARLIPSDRPHLMSDVFPHLSEYAPVPRGEGTYELTRIFALGSETDRLDRDQMAGQLFCGLIEYLLSCGASTLTIVMDTFFLPGLLAMGWSVQPLGVPQPYDEGICIAVRAAINEQMLASTRRTRNVTGPVLRRAPHRIKAVA